MLASLNYRPSPSITYTTKILSIAFYIYCFNQAFIVKYPGKYKKNMGKCEVLQHPGII